MPDLKIVKVGAEDATPKNTPIKPVEDPKLITGGKKTQKTFPRGILKTAKAKIRPTSNPSKAPPMKRHTIRLFTEKGAHKHRKTIKKTIRKLSDEKVKKIVMNAGLLKSPDMPPKLMREILEGGMVAGFVSLS